MKKKILFVCIENSNRSQMAEAFTHLISEGSVIAYSAGSSPSGKINPKAISSMKDVGYDLSVHKSKSLEEVKRYSPFDVVVTMGCGDACPWMPANEHIDWNIPDPRDMPEDDFKKVRNLIAEEVSSLLKRLNNS
jgi:arsenate reductase